jgi:bacillithiol system protein YtxJ
MKTPFTPITSITALERLVDHARQHPVVLFKHDPTCPISAAAYQEMARLQEDVAVVDVGQHNDIAQEIAARTGIEHESPQVIVFADGQPIWSASRYDITATGVEQAVQGR